MQITPNQIIGKIYLVVIMMCGMNKTLVIVLHKLLQIGILQLIGGEIKKTDKYNGTDCIMLTDKLQQMDKMPFIMFRLNTIIIQL